MRCLICAGGAEPSELARSRSRTGATFQLASCNRCGFVFVTEPRIDFEQLYDNSYYSGRGYDGSVNYAAETSGNTVRAYEWTGIAKVVRSIRPTPIRSWLDYGCGYGGLVSALMKEGVAAIGYDIGHPSEVARLAGIPVAEDAELAAMSGRYDVISAIEVLEHAIDPMFLLRRFRQLLAPGGLLFLTTGNAARHHDNMANWRYVVPEIHVSFFEPRTLEFAYREAGLVPIIVGNRPGMTEILRYKILKSLGIQEQKAWQRIVPWRLAGYFADRIEGVSAQPAALRPL
jgi:SAM-dependent methyltransferase